MSQNIVGPPRLATGSHPDSKIYMCGMNVISWENGDTPITDTPECTPIPLARIVHHVNDHFCTHSRVELDSSTGRKVRTLCADCAPKVLDLAHRTVGRPTGTLGQGWQWISYLLRDTHQRATLASTECKIVTDAIGIALSRAAGERVPLSFGRSSSILEYVAAIPLNLRLANSVINSDMAPMRNLFHDAGRLYISMEQARQTVRVVPVGNTVFTDDEVISLLTEGGTVGSLDRNYLLDNAHRAIDMWSKAVPEPVSTPSSRPEAANEPLTV